MAANAVGNLKETSLNPFCIHISIRKSRAAAIIGTARKLAIIIWDMVTKPVPYNPPKQYEFLAQKRQRKVKEIQRSIAKFGINQGELALS